MIRTFVASVCALALSTGVALAGEIKGTFVKFDAEKKVLTLKVDGKDTDILVTEESKVAGKKPTPFLKRFAKKAPAEGSAWEATTETKDGKETLVEIKPGKKTK